MNENKRVIKAFVAICVLFLVIICYLTVFELFFKEDIIDDPYNRRIGEVGKGGTTTEIVLQGDCLWYNRIVRYGTEKGDHGC